MLGRDKIEISFDPFGERSERILLRVDMLGRILNCVELMSKHCRNQIRTQREMPVKRCSADSRSSGYGTDAYVHAMHHKLLACRSKEGVDIALGINSRHS
jgi:hypothetical protein